MRFQLLPIISIIEEIYKLPIGGARFTQYISKLQGGTKGDLRLPIGGFNPMAKNHVLAKVEELKRIGAEQIIESTLHKLNDTLKYSEHSIIKVALNLADDLKGGWTNQYTTDFDSKFKIQALVRRNFCTPYFWSSEEYNTDLIVNRTLAYAYRTIYFLKNARPVTLKDCVNQEIFVCQNTKMEEMKSELGDFNFIQGFYNRYKQNDDYNIIFNFFYGDLASQSLNFPTYGIKANGGFEFVKWKGSRTN